MYLLRFLDEELERERLPYRVHRTLREDASLRLRATSAPAAPAPPTPPAVPTPAARPARPAPAPAALPEAYVARRPEPQVEARPAPAVPAWRAEAKAFVARTTATVRSDLAVHGLAYLGVLLFFAGVFGFVVFAFGDVSKGLRPVAELAIPLAVFGAAIFLYRRGSRFVAAALELLGGALVPIIVVASFADGSDIPPDPHGDALAVSLGVAMLVVAFVYAVVVRRREESPLRFLVAPVLWLGVALAASPTVSGAGHGSALARPSAWQMAITALAVFVTALLARVAKPRALALATELVVLPGLAVVLALEVVGLARDGWPGWPLLVTSLAALATVEVQGPGLPDVSRAPLEALAAIGIGVAFGLEVGDAWGAAAATVVLLAVAEWNGRRRPNRWLAAVTVVPAGCAVVLAFGGVWAAVIASGVAVAWVHVRRIVRVSWFDVDADFVDVLAVTVSAMFGAALVDALGAATGLLVVAALLAATSIVVRVTPARQQRMWSWGVPLGVVTTLGAALAASDVATSGVLAATAALLGVAAACAPAPTPVRVWITSAAWAAAAGLAFDQVGIALTTAGAALGVIGLGLVVVSVARRGPTVAHLGAVGVVVGAATTAVAFSDVGVTTVVAVACGTAGWILGAVAQETGGWSTTDLVAERVLRRARHLPPAFALVGVAGTALVALRVGTDAPLSKVTAATVLTGVGVLGALGARELRQRALTASSLAWAGAVLGLVAVWIATANHDDALTGVVAGVVALSLVVVVPGERRGRVLGWVGWMLTAVATTFVAFAAGLARANTEVAVFAWGSVVLMGALLFDDLVEGRRARGQLVRDARAVAPAVLGLGGMVVAAWATVDASAVALGWWSLAGAAVVLVVAVQLRQAALSAVSWLLLVPAVVLLGPGTVPADPWALVALASAEVVLGIVLAAATPGRRDVLDRWDLAAFAVGNVVALGVVGMASESTSPVAVYLVMGLWSLAVALVVRLRLHAWATAWAVVGVALLDVAAGWAGAAWLTGALAATAVVTTVVATRLRGPARAAAQTTGAVAALGAGIAGIWWWDPTQSSAVAAAGLAAGAIALLAVALVRWARLSADWLVPWVGVAVLALIAAGVEAVDATMPRAGVGLAVGVAFVALASALAAAPVRQAPLRVVAAALVPGSIAIALVAVGASLDSAAVAAGVLGFAAVLVAAMLAVRRPASPWTAPALVLAAISVGGAVGIGIADLPDRGLLVAALALAGAALGVFGVVFRRVWVLACAPVLLCAAWIVYASEALAGNPQWFTVPIGLTLLVVDALLRAALRARGDDPHTPVTVGLDYAGLSFLVGASVVQIATVSAWFVLVGVALGVAVCAWGAVTRVVHRTWFGAGTVVLSLLVAIALPLVELVPQLEGAELWISIAAVGIVALVFAAFLEQGRRRAEAGIAHLRDLTSTWER